MTTAPTEKLDPSPPCDLDAERCAIASLMLSGDDCVIFSKTRRVLRKESFFLPEHGVLFGVLCEMADAGKGIDSITFRAELKSRGVLEEIGGNVHLGQILNTLPAPAHGPHYARIVAERARERDAIRIATRLTQRLLQPLGETGAADAIQKSIQLLWNVVTSGRDLSFWSIGSAAEDFLDRRLNAKPSAVESGIYTMDQDYCGVLTLGGYTLVAARPSMGKSTWIRSLLNNRAKAGIKCGLIAVEENEDKIAGNAISSETEIENSHVAYGTWTDYEMGRIGEAVQRLGNVPLWGTDTALNLVDVLTAAEILATQHDCQIIAIDHIHLIQGHRAETREQQISEISGAFKGLIKRLGICGIVAAQLNRPEKGVCPPAPQLTDLRGSGALEEHADAVVMLHREDYYYRGRADYIANRMAQVLIRKNRNGCVGDFLMEADLMHQRFLEISTHPY